MSIYFFNFLSLLFFSMSEFELYEMIFLNRLSMSSVFLTILSTDA